MCVSVVDVVGPSAGKRDRQLNCVRARVDTDWEHDIDGFLTIENANLARQWTLPDLMNLYYRGLIYKFEHALGSPSQ